MLSMTKPKPGSRQCPICGKPAAQASRPFCSDRCKQVDLNRWLSGGYVIPVRSDDDDEDGEGEGEGEAGEGEASEGEAGEGEGKAGTPDKPSA